MHNFSSQPYDGAKADVWSCGIMLFILLFGRHPFLRPEDTVLPEQQQMLVLFTRTSREEFVLGPAEAAAVSPACADFLGRVLATRPERRCGGGAGGGGPRLDPPPPCMGAPAPSSCQEATPALSAACALPPGN
jgi:serine/threonine protein kinase